MDKRGRNGPRDAGPTTITAKGVGLSLFEDLLLVGGVASVTVGLWWKAPWLALVVLGGMLILAALRLGRKK